MVGSQLGIESLAVGGDEGEILSQSIVEVPGDSLALSIGCRLSDLGTAVFPPRTQGEQGHCRREQGGRAQHLDDERDLIESGQAREPRGRERQRRRAGQPSHYRHLLPRTARALPAAPGKSIVKERPTMGRSWPRLFMSSDVYRHSTAGRLTSVKLASPLVVR